MTQEEKFEKAKRLYETANADQMYVLESLFPELKEGEDERIRKAIINVFATHKDYEIFFGASVGDILAWLEKQAEQKSEEIDNIHNYLYGEQKPADKVEPKFKVKYAGSEYNVFETKYSAGVTFYGIEDEPNHIDYVQAEDCEIIGGYGIKENSSPYPTKPAVFSEQKPAWSEEDEKIYQSIIDDTVQENQLDDKQINWLKSLRHQNRWKPSEEQMKALLSTLPIIKGHGNSVQSILETLYDELKELKGE